MSLLVGLSMLLLMPLWKLLNIVEKSIFFILMIFMLVSYLLTIIVNPGVVPKSKNLSLTEDLE